MAAPRSDRDEVHRDEDVRTIRLVAAAVSVAFLLFLSSCLFGIGWLAYKHAGDHVSHVCVELRDSRLLDYADADHPLPGELPAAFAARHARLQHDTRRLEAIEC